MLNLDGSGEAAANFGKMGEVRQLLLFFAVI